MPDIDGMEVFRRSRKFERFTDLGAMPPPAFMLLTAERDRTFLELALDIGFVQVMQKPPDENRLISQLKEIQKRCENWRPTPVAHGAACPIPSLTCPLPSNSGPLADDVLLAINTLGEAIEALVAFEDTDALRLLYEQLSPQLKRIDESVGPATCLSLAAC